MPNKMIQIEGFEDVYSEVATIIDDSKQNLAKIVNNSITTTYWNIGKILYEQVLQENRAEYGEAIMEEISNRLTNNYGKGFNLTSLFRMVKFYQEFSNPEILATLSQQLTWSHFVELLPIEDPLKRDFYAAMCKNERWSVRTLRERKKSMLYERTAISQKPELTIQNEIAELRDDRKMSVDMFYRDPYVLDFLGLKDTYSEKDLENAILSELEHFILEMGSDFAFLARQKHFVLDGKDYYIDLLFYHRTMRRLVAIELKLGEFEPQDKGQTELYLRWLDKYERAEGEETPIALIFCAEKSQETIELLELNKGNIHVAQYLTKMPPKEVLQEKLSLAIANARKHLDSKLQD